MHHHKACVTKNEAIETFIFIFGNDYKIIKKYLTSNIFLIYYANEILTILEHNFDAFSPQIL